MKPKIKIIETSVWRYRTMLACGGRLCAVVAATLVASTIIAPSISADAPTTHIVTWGETLYSIARSYGTTPQAIAGANGISLNRWVYVGERLMIPLGSSRSNNSVAPNGTYLVRSGETLQSVASRFSLSAEALASANNLPPNGFLYVGASLRIPTRSASASRSSIEAGSSVLNYIVQPGDSLPLIALRHGTTAQAIAIANNLPNFWLIIAGQRLIIPQPPAPRAIPAVSTISKIEVRVANIPLYRQQQTLTCEQAAVAMATRGVVTEPQLLNTLPRNDNPFVGIRGRTNANYFGGLSDYGVYAQPLQKALGAFGLKSQVLHGQGYDDFKHSILEHLRAGHAIVWWHTWREIYAKPVLVRTTDRASVKLVPYEHVGVIVGANDRGVTYHDPYDATVRSASWADHRRVSGYFDNMALVVW